MLLVPPCLQDMGGGALVLALAHVVMSAGDRLPVRLRVLVPAVENAISGAAYRPGDVLQTRAGITVENNNTGAAARTRRLSQRMPA